MMYYLTRTRVNAFFGKGRLLISPSHGLPYSLVPQVNQPQITTTNTEGHGRPAALGPPAGFPPVALGTSTSSCAQQCLVNRIIQLVKRQRPSLSLLSRHTPYWDKKMPHLRRSPLRDPYRSKTMGNVGAYPRTIFSAIPRAETVGEWMILPVRKRR